MKILKKLCIIGFMLGLSAFSFGANMSLSDIKVKDIKGNVYSFVANGKPTYLKLWASWCPACLSGLHEIDELSKKVKKFDVVTVVFPEMFGEKNIIEFKKWYDLLGYKNIKVLVDEKGEIAKIIRHRVYPTSVILDKNGEVQLIVPGHLNDKQLNFIFDKLMEKNNKKSR